MDVTDLIHRLVMGQGAVWEPLFWLTVGLVLALTVATAIIVLVFRLGARAVIRSNQDVIAESRQAVAKFGNYANKVAAQYSGVNERLREHDGLLHAQDDRIRRLEQSRTLDDGTSAGPLAAPERDPA